MKDQTKHCKNCNAEFNKEFEFCPYCGQKAKDELTLGLLFYNTISNYFAFDARFFKSFIPLMLKPGYVARKFVEGKRLQYLHPAQYYLFVSIVFFFLISFQVRDYNAMANEAMKEGFKMEKEDKELPVNTLDSTDIVKITDPLLKNPIVTKDLSEAELKALDSTLKTNLSKSSKPKLNFGYDTKKLDSLIAVGASEEAQMKAIGLDENSGWFERMFMKQVIKFQKQEGGGIVQAISDTIPIAMFFLLPIFALILKVFYWKRGRYAHHLVFSFYYFSFLYVVIGLVFGINYFLTDIPDWIDWLIILSTFIYLWLSMKNFYRQGYFISLIKAGMSTFIYMLFIVPMALAIIVTVSFLFY
jgi:hypothetical protein